MSESAIVVEDLGKKYVLQHQASRQHKNYTALRDVIPALASRVFRDWRKSGDTSAESARQEDFWALREVSFSVKRGEATAIIGRNGAGKSTLLKLLSRITAPSTGSIEVNGRVASLLEVGTGFHPELTGRENIFLNGAIIGMTRAEIRRRFDEIVAFAEVEKFLDTPVKRYSSGMYVRLAFAIAAHLESEVLIVDEVLAVGDAEFQKKCLGKMNDAARSDRTVLFVSHNMAAVQQLCTTGILLQGGRIVENNTIDVVVNRYLKTAGQVEYQIDLESKSRAWSRDERIALVGLEVNRGERPLYGEPCEFAITARIATPLQNLCFEIGFSGLDGMRYGTYDTWASGLKIDAGTGLLRLHLRIPKLPFHPSLYLIDIGVHSGGTGLDFLAGVTQIDVLPGPVTPLYRTGGTRSVDLAGDWTIKA